jgi:hypothetical protein
MPVGINALSKDFNVLGISRKALRSIPDDPAVAYSGNWFGEVLTIFTATGMGKYRC